MEEARKTRKSGPFVESGPKQSEDPCSPFKSHPHPLSDCVSWASD